MKISIRRGIPGIPGGKVPTRTKPAHSTTSGCREDTGEADGACSGADGENESEKGHGHLSSVPTGDPRDVGWVEKAWVV